MTLYEELVAKLGEKKIAQLKIREASPDTCKVEVPYFVKAKDAHAKFVVTVGIERGLRFTVSGGEFATYEDARHWRRAVKKATRKIQKFLAAFNKESA